MGIDVQHADRALARDGAQDRGWDGVVAADRDRRDPGGVKGREVDLDRLD